MLILNFILIFFLAAFVWLGLKSGIIRSLGAFLGVGTGIWAASRLYEIPTGFVGILFFGHYGLAGMVCYILIFVLIMRFSSFVFYLADKFLNLSEHHPALKKFNRLGGAAFGFLQGAVILGLAMSAIVKYPWGIFLEDLINNSFFASGLAEMGGWLVFMLPEAML